MFWMLAGISVLGGSSQYYLVVAFWMLLAGIRWIISTPHIARLITTDKRESVTSTTTVNPNDESKTKPPSRKQVLKFLKIYKIGLGNRLDKLQAKRSEAKLAMISTFMRTIKLSGMKIFTTTWGLSKKFRKGKEREGTGAAKLKSRWWTHPDG